MLEDLPDVDDMLLESYGVDKDVVDVSYDVVLQHLSEHILNKACSGREFLALMTYVLHRSSLLK